MFAYVYARVSALSSLRRKDAISAEASDGPNVQRTCVHVRSIMNIHCMCVLVLSGAGHRLSQHLHGELAGLMVLNNHTEADHVIQCINSCEQKLDFHAINEMETGMVGTHLNTHILPDTCGLFMSDWQRLNAFQWAMQPPKLPVLWGSRPPSNTWFCGPKLVSPQAASQYS